MLLHFIIFSFSLSPNKIDWLIDWTILNDLDVVLLSIHF